MIDASALADVVAIPVTPFTEGAVDVERYSVLLRRLVDAGVTVVTPNGNTSEFYTLSPAERLDLLAATGSAVPEATIVAGIGLDIASAIFDGRAALRAGARFAMVHQPVHPYISRDGWVDYHRTIAEALPDLGIVLYIRAPWVDAAMLTRLVESAPNVVAVKYAVPDAVTFARVSAEPALRHLVWIAGLAEPYALGYAVHGARGFTSGLVNVNPLLSIDLRDALRRGDVETADRLSRSIDRFEELRADDRSANNVSVVKEALAQLGLCSRDVRPPSSPVGDRARRDIAEILDAWSADHDLALETPRLTIRGAA